MYNPEANVIWRLFARAQVKFSSNIESLSSYHTDSPLELDTISFIHRKLLKRLMLWFPFTRGQHNLHRVHWLAWVHTAGMKLSRTSDLALICAALTQNNGSWNESYLQRWLDDLQFLLSEFHQIVDASFLHGGGLALFSILCLGIVSHRKATCPSLCYFLPLNVSAETFKMIEPRSGHPFPFSVLSTDCFFDCLHWSLHNPIENNYYPRSVT